MDEVTGETATVGERLRSARLAQNISLEDVASRTRIPTRHLESLEASEWSRLPAATYTIGFARSYAGVLGLDRTEIADALRLEMGAGTLAPRPEAQVFEPADPARVMPRWLVVLALLALVGVVAAFLLMRNQELSGPDEVAAPVEEAAPVAAQAPAAPAPSPQAATGPVVITATEPAWIQISERGGRTLFSGELVTGQSFEVPATATAPVLRTGRPQSIRIAVGSANAPAVGPADTVVSNLSLAPADLLRGPAATPAAPAAPVAR
jgi:cytoskeletal protein RodZ